MVDHIILEVPSTYKMIVGRELLNSPRATPSNYSLKMQCLAYDGSIGRIIGDYKNVIKDHITTLKAIAYILNMK